MAAPWTWNSPVQPPQEIEASSSSDLEKDFYLASNQGDMKTNHLHHPLHFHRIAFMYFVVYFHALRFFEATDLH